MIGVAREVAYRRKRGVGVVRVQLPIHGVVHPVIVALRSNATVRVAAAQVVGQTVVVVRSVQKPGKRELLGVAKTSDPLRFTLGFHNRRRE